MTITITKVANPKYSSADNSSIDVTLTTVEHGIIPFTARATDSMLYGQELFAALQQGDYGNISSYVTPSS